MGDIVNRHNFDNSLRKIDNFSRCLPNVPKIDNFKTSGGLFGWGDHYVNGTEMNDFVEKIQEILKRQNDISITTIKEFREIYKTFDFLDKEYIQGILGTVKAANKASNQAKTASDQARIASEQAKEAAFKALKNEEDIHQELTALSAIVAKLKSLKEEFNLKIQNIERSVEKSGEKFKSEIFSMIPTREEVSDVKKEIALVLTTNFIGELELLGKKVITLESEANELASDFLNLDAGIAEKMASAEESYEQRLKAVSNHLLSELERESRSLHEADSQQKEMLLAELNHQCDALDNIRILVETKSDENRQAVEDSENSILEKLHAESDERAARIAEVQTFAQTKSDENRQAVEDSENTILDKLRAESDERAARFAEVQTFAQTTADENRQTVENYKNECKIEIKRLGDNIDSLHNALVETEQNLKRQMIIAYVIGSIGVIIGALAIIF